MSLENMMTAQEALQVESYGGRSPRDLRGEEQIEFIRWNVLALEDELHEALAETGWKPWATSKHVNTEAFKGELVDVMHFFMNLCTTVGMDADELEERYFAKRQKNADRQKEGYDGVSAKCPLCKRALDDDAVTCHRKNAKFFTCSQHGTFINYTTQPEPIGDEDRRPIKTRRYWGTVILPVGADLDALLAFIDGKKSWREVTVAKQSVDRVGMTVKIAATYGPVRGNCPADFRAIIQAWARKEHPGAEVSAVVDDVVDSPVEKF